MTRSSLILLAAEPFLIKLDHSMKLNTYVEVQFYPWFKFYSLLFLGLLMSDNEFETKENKIKTKDETEPQHLYQY